MRKNTRIHTVQYVKRLAKKIKKEQNLQHIKALDFAANSIGYKNWKHLYNDSKEQVEVIRVKDTNLDPRRNLLVAAINHLILEKHILLDLDQIDEYSEKGHVFVNIFDQKSVVIWRNIGWGELSVSVWWKYNHSKHPQANLKANAKERFNSSKPLAKEQHYRNFVGATVSCWFERKDGVYIQGDRKEWLFDIYTRRGELEMLKEMPVQTPKGYSISGDFRM